MEMWAQLMILSVTTLTSFFILIILSQKRSRTAPKLIKFPPGPKPIPVIGNLLQLGQSPHKSLQALSKIYGPIMTLKLGMMRNTIVISSPHFAKQILQTHDHVFSDRIVSDTICVLNHHNLSVAMLPVSPQWRKLRKAMATQMFSQARLNSSQSLRLQKVKELIDHIGRQTCLLDHQKRPLLLEHVVFVTVLNFLSNTLFSVDLAHYESDEPQEFKQLVVKMLDLGGKSNLSDYFPLLRYLDPQGLRRDNESNLTSIIKIFEHIIDERVSSRSDQLINGKSGKSTDVLDVLLDQDQEGELVKLTCQEIKHLCADIYIAGADSTSGTIEWAMTELMRHPSKLVKAQTELRTIIGKDAPLKESDLPKLPYLQAVVKETLRLHSPTPLLLPHKAQTDTQIYDFLIKKDSQVLINVWAMGRDPDLWSKALSFEPERFLDSDIDFKGQNFEMVPFGAGRRICPGLSLAQRMIPLILGSLVHEFKWKLEDGMLAEDIDLSDKFGITLLLSSHSMEQRYVDAINGNIVRTAPTPLQLRTAPSSGRPSFSISSPKVISPDMVMNPWDANNCPSPKRKVSSMHRVRSSPTLYGDGGEGHQQNGSGIQFGRQLGTYQGYRNQNQNQAHARQHCGGLYSVNSLQPQDLYRGTGRLEHGRGRLLLGYGPTDRFYPASGRPYKGPFDEGSNHVDRSDGNIPHPHRQG